MIRARDRARGGFSGSAPFTPASISGLTLWLDASDSATITQAANLVSQWNDKSSSAFHFTQGTGTRQPITNTRTINGINSLDFDGSNDNLRNASIAASLTGDVTIFIVALCDGYGATQNIFRKDGGEFNLQYNSTGTTLSASKTTGFTFSNYTRTADTNAHIIGMVASGSSVFAFQDGFKATSASASATAAGTTILGADVFSSVAFNGLIGEVIIYNRSLPDSESNQVGAYLSTKWGPTWTNF